MTHPTADYLARIQRREHEHHHAMFRVVGPGVPEMEFTDQVKVFGDVVEIHNVAGVDYFIPAHQIRFITHETSTCQESKGWNLHL